MQKIAYAVSLLIIAIFSWYYFISRGFPLEIQYINAVAAFSSTVIIALSAIAGPLARFIPRLRKIVETRRPLGLVGFGLAALHTALVVPILLQDARAATLSDTASIAFAAIAFMIFALMALTSTSSWVEKLGLENWKNLQRLGYLAMAFVIFPVILLQGGVFLNRITGQAVILIVLVAILARAIVLIMKKPAVESGVDHLVLRH